MYNSAENKVEKINNLKIKKKLNDWKKKFGDPSDNEGKKTFQNSLTKANIF